MKRITMRKCTVGSVLTKLYGRVPYAQRLLGIAVRLEGGQMTSLTLRQVLKTHYGVEVGDYSYGSLLLPGHADRGTKIGSYVSVGPGVRRFGAAHPIDDLCLHPYWYNPKLGFSGQESDVERTSCWIGHGAWVGANAIILPGCSRIGVGAIVGAGAVVTRDVPDFAVVAGNPAKELRSRLAKEQRAAILDARHWEKDPAEAHATLQAIRRRQ